MNRYCKYKVGCKVFSLTLIKVVEIKNDNYKWLVRCDCGKEKTVYSNHFVGKNPTKSCGCLRKEPLLKTKFHRAYVNLKQRCENKNNPNYFRYGGRGIKCLWTSFEEFKIDMYESYQSHNNYYGGRKTSIDRIDSNGNYCAENCRWVTQEQQAKNRNKRYYHKKLT